MKFFDYLDVSYQNLNIDMQKDKYDSFKHAKTLATQDLIQTQRNVFKWINYFVIIFGYWFGQQPEKYSKEQLQAWQDERLKKAEEAKIRMVPKA